MPYWGQQVTTSSLTYVYSYYTYFLLLKLLFHGPHHHLCLISGPPYFFFSHPLTPVPFSTPHITIAYTHLHILLSGRGGPIEGVHPPSPSSFAPWRNQLVLGSLVSRLQKNQDWTRPRPPRTRNSQDHQRLQPQSSLQSLRILEISRLIKDQSNQSQPVFSVS